MVLAAFLFMRRMAAVRQAGFTSLLRDEEKRRSKPAPLRNVPPGVEVFEITGPFFFGVANAFKDALHTIERTPQVLILRLRHVPASMSRRCGRSRTCASARRSRARTWFSRGCSRGRWPR